MKNLFENWRKYLQEQEPEGKPKVIFMAGGPGSGKSSVLSAFELPAVNIINADDYYEAAIENAGLPLGGKPEIMKRRQALQTELEDLEPGSEEALEKQAEIEATGKEFSQYQKLFNKALKYKATTFDKSLEARQDFIVDGTGGKRGDMITKKAQLEEAGYDVGMIFVDSDLKIALERNRERGRAGGRELLNKEIKSSYAVVQKNKNFYRELFGDNFFYVSTQDLVALASDIAEIKPQLQQFFADEQLEENDYPITAQRANKEINQVIRPTKKKNALTKLPGWKRARADYLGSAPPGAGGS